MGRVGCAVLNESGSLLLQLVYMFRRAVALDPAADNKALVVVLQPGAALEKAVRP